MGVFKKNKQTKKPWKPLNFETETIFLAFGHLNLCRNISYFNDLAKLEMVIFKLSKLHDLNECYWIILERTTVYDVSYYLLCTFQPVQENKRRLCVYVLEDSFLVILAFETDKMGFHFGSCF